MHLLTALLFVSTVAAATAADCCSYPLLLSSVRVSNVSQVQFQCSEPIAFSCSSIDTGTFPVAGVIANNTGLEVAKKSVLQTSVLTIKANIECDVDTKLWKYSSSSPIRYATFGCAWRDWDGNWFTI